MRGVEAEWQRLIDVVRGKKMVSPGLEVILRIRRLPRSFRGAHGGFAPPSLLIHSTENVHTSFTTT